MDLVVEGKAYINGEFTDCCIGVNNGKITDIKRILKGDKHYRFPHRLILPTGIDIHVHFRDPGFTYKEDFSTGSIAALFGGVSCIFDMPNTKPKTISVKDILDKISIGEKKSYVDFGVYAGLTNNNIRNIESLAEKCSGFKIFLGSTTGSFSFDENNLKEVFDGVSSTEKPVLIHAENSECLKKNKIHENNLKDHIKSRPSICEVISIRKIIKLSRETDVKVHICHLSSCEGLVLLKDKPKNVTYGVTPHHALLSVEQIDRNPTYFKVNPPIRTSFDRDSLFDAVCNGVVDVLESDHAPHTLDDKDNDFSNAPSGMPGVETMFPLFLSMVKKEKLSFQRLVSVVCEKPAELLGVSKGKIEVGRDADFIVVDMKDERRVKSEMLHSKCGWSPFEGWNAIFPSFVFIRGEKLIEDYGLMGREGFGRFTG